MRAAQATECWRHGALATGRDREKKGQGRGGGVTGIGVMRRDDLEAKAGEGGTGACAQAQRAGRRPGARERALARHRLAGRIREREK